MLPGENASMNIMQRELHEMNYAFISVRKEKVITGFLWDEAVVFSSRIFYKVLRESWKFTRGWGLLASWGEGLGELELSKQRNRGFGD